jgi:hypothetical protein
LCFIHRTQVLKLGHCRCAALGSHHGGRVIHPLRFLCFLLPCMYVSYDGIWHQIWPFTITKTERFCKLWSLQGRQANMTRRLLSCCPVACSPHNVTAKNSQVGWNCVKSVLVTFSFLFLS